MQMRRGRDVAETGEVLHELGGRRIDARPVMRDDDRRMRAVARGLVDKDLHVDAIDGQRFPSRVRSHCRSPCLIGASRPNASPGIYRPARDRSNAIVDAPPLPAYC